MLIVSHQNSKISDLQIPSLQASKRFAFGLCVWARDSSASVPTAIAVAGCPCPLVVAATSVIHLNIIMFLARTAAQRASRNSSARRSLSTNAASDYFATLRWRATEALTSIMTKEEKERLLKRMDVHIESETTPKQQQVNEEEVQKTIAEAVVAARTEEAQRQQAQWEREKARLHAEAEQAAYERVEADLKIQQQRAAALEKWKADVAQETNAQVVKEEADHHPVLGQVVADFGFKRLHVVSAKTLANIPVWKKQRIYRHDRAKAMAADKLKTSHFGLPGVIALHEVRVVVY